MCALSIAPPPPHSCSSRTVLSLTRPTPRRRWLQRQLQCFNIITTKREARNQPASVLEAMTIPCITMVGTTPTFYLVPVTKELSDAVMTGQHPPTQTQVLKCVTVAGHQRRISDGMADIEFRKLTLKRFVAFKNLARSHWQNFI